MELAFRASDHANKTVAFYQAVYQEIHSTCGDHTSGDGHTQYKH